MPSGEIPLTITDGPVELDVTLDNVDLTLRLFYVERTSSWYLVILDAVDSSVIQGATRLTANWPLTFGSNPRLPSGLLLCVREGSEDVRLRDLPDRAFLWYQSLDDLTAVEGLPVDYLVSAQEAS